MAKALAGDKKDADMDQIMFDLAMRESRQLPDEKVRVSPRNRKQEIKTFRRSELCLVCQMSTLFIQYQFMERPATVPKNHPTGGEKHNSRLTRQESMEIENQVIEPDNVRAALEKTFFAINPDTAYTKGEMGCAQETFTEILTHFHREHVYPEYLEQWIKIAGND